jgi:Spy/CpxP family protein refolding chaperone
MRGNLRRLAILFSAALNLGFLGAYAWRLAARGAEPDGALPYLSLHLTEEQQRRFDPLRHEFHARMADIGGQIQQERLRLLDLLAPPDQDRRAVRAAQETILRLQGEMQDAVVEHLVAQCAIFTPEQRARFFGILRERIEAADEALPPWMSRGAAQPAAERRH